MYVIGGRRWFWWLPLFKTHHNSVLLFFCQVPFHLTLYIYNKSNLIIQWERAPSLTLTSFGRWLDEVAIKKPIQTCDLFLDRQDLYCNIAVPLLFICDITKGVESFAEVRGTWRWKFGDVFKIEYLLTAAATASLVIPTRDHEVEANTNTNDCSKTIQMTPWLWHSI